MVTLGSKGVWIIKMFRATEVYSHYTAVSHQIRSTSGAYVRLILFMHIACMFTFRTLPKLVDLRQVQAPLGERN